MMDQPLSPPPPSMTLIPHHHPQSLSFQGIVSAQDRIQGLKRTLGRQRAELTPGLCT